MDQLDPVAIFNYHVENPNFTVYHLVAHMVIMRNALPWERYRRYRRGYSQRKDSKSSPFGNC